MMKNHKRAFLASAAADDRISNLSEDLTNSILERLPVQDAVRTSILSKEWRYRWTTMRALVFDHHFSKRFAKNGAFGRNGFIRIINQLVFLHKGPILKFSLHIPTLDLDSFQEVDQWMLFLSRNSVRELVLPNLNRHYQLPSYVFSCLELKRLNLAACIFKPPLEFEWLLNLEHLMLWHVDFRANSCRTLATLPQLKKLHLYSCKNVYNLNIEARTLQKLIVIACPDALLPRLLDSPCLTTIFLSLKTPPIEAFEQVGRMNLVNLLCNILSDRAKNEYFIIDGHFLKFFSAEEIRKWLPHAVNLWFVNFQLTDLDELRGALCLLRNSPNLESLFIMHAQMEPQVIHNDVRPASNHLESPDCLDLTFKQLETVEIRTFVGSRPELLFIKLLLAHSPSLQKMTIEPSSTSDVHERFDIAKDVMRFSRASPEAEMIYLEPKP